MAPHYFPGRLLRRRTQVAAAFIALLLILFGLGACASDTGSSQSLDSAPAHEGSAEPVPPLPPDDQRVIPRTAFLGERGDWQPLGAITRFQQEGNQVIFQLADQRELRIYFASDSVYRLRFSPSGNYAADHSWAVVRRELGPVHLSVRESASAVVLATPALELSIAKAAFALTVRQDGRIISQDSEPIASSGSRVVCYKDLAAGDRFFGFGEKAGPLMKNGQSMRMWNTDAYAYTKSDDSLYMSIPFFVNAGQRATWGILLDNSFQTFFNAGKDRKDQLWFGASGGDLDYWFMAAPDLAGVLAAYTELTGHFQLPPQWALGYQQSRYSYTSAKEVLNIANTFRQKQIPADVIYMDIDFMDGYKDFTSHPIAFPDPESLLDSLHRQGFKAITILDPGIKIEEGYAPYDSGLARDIFVRNAAGELSHGRVWPGDCVFPDFTNPVARAWWGQLYAPLIAWGFDGFWNDMNEPAVFDTPNNTLPWNARHQVEGQLRTAAEIHNVYGQQMTRASLEGLDQLRPGQRNLVLSRAGYAGSQRYASFWTGDNSATWDHLKLNVTMALGLGLSGFPLVGADVGGYKGNPSPELFARWMQVGALIPFFRNHTEKGAGAHEPWAFGPEVEAVAKAAIELRYRLLPHYYSLARQASLNGSPIIRPLFWEFPRDDKAYAIEDEFLVGQGLLAAPVITKDATSRIVWLPPGSDWYDWVTGQKHSGGTSIEIDAPLSALPLFVRAGSIIPVRELEQWVGEKPDANLTFRIWPGAKVSYRLYEDDGLSTAYQNGAFRETVVELQSSDRYCRISVSPAGSISGFKPKRSYTWLELNLDAKPRSVKLNGQDLPIIEAPALGTKVVPAPALWEASTRHLLVRSDDPDKTWILEIATGE